MLDALRKRYEADIANAYTTALIYTINSSVGIGEQEHSTLMSWINL